ncbi:hypothetical protein MY11210_005147 [Beauveria gryllotalpidicola]
MKVSTTSFLLASLYGSALAAPIISGDLISDAVQSATTSTTGLGNVAPGNTASGNVAPVNDLAKGLTGAVGQPGGVVGRDHEQKATVVLTNGELVAAKNTADANANADVRVRNLDAKTKGVAGQLVDSDSDVKFHPFAKPPADVNVDTLVNARNLDAKAKGVVGQLVDSDAKAKVHPFAKPPVDVNVDALVDARSVDAKADGVVDHLADVDATAAAHPLPRVAPADNIVQSATGSVKSAAKSATNVDVNDVAGGQTLPIGNL